MGAARKPWHALACALGLLSLGEVAFQTRAQIRHGQSVFNAVFEETTYVYQTALGLNVLRPNSVIRGSESVIETNSLGLRSPELTTAKPPGEFRIAVLAAVLHYTPTQWTPGWEKWYRVLPAPAQALVVAMTVWVLIAMSSGQAPFIYFQF
jgi:hypothetical protein